jgi:hypothetical protein
MPAHTPPNAANTLGGWTLRAGWRRIGALLSLGLTLAVAACGVTTTIGAQPTATPSPTAPPSVDWRLQDSPNPARPPQSALLATTTLSPTDAWAVGHAFAETDGQQTLIERWDGVAWRIVASPGLDQLNAIAAVSTADVWAVGGSFNYGVGPHPDKPLVEHWNGSQWSVVVTPNRDANAVELVGVAVLAANNIWAVGREDVGAAHTNQALIERWDGSAWSLVAAPLPAGAAGTALRAITPIPGSQQLWAVGYLQPSTNPGYAQVLIERWNGSAWQIISSPTLPQGAFGASLNGVTALTETDAWAVGEYIASDHTIRTLALHWDGATWKIASSPDTWGTLSSVAAHGTHDVRAVGHAISGDGNPQAALVLQWDGSAWHRIAPPTPGGATHSNLTGVTADPAGTFWAVGAYQNRSGNRQTLIERCP